MWSSLGMSFLLGSSDPISLTATRLSSFMHSIVRKQKVRPWSLVRYLTMASSMRRLESSSKQMRILCVMYSSRMSSVTASPEASLISAKTFSSSFSMLSFFSLQVMTLDWASLKLLVEKALARKNLMLLSQEWSSSPYITGNTWMYSISPIQYIFCLVMLKRSSNSLFEITSSFPMPLSFRMATLLRIGGILYFMLFQNSFILFSLSCSNAAKWNQGCSRSYFFIWYRKSSCSFRSTIQDLIDGLQQIFAFPSWKYIAYPASPFSRTIVSRNRNRGKLPSALLSSFKNTTWSQHAPRLLRFALSALSSLSIVISGLTSSLMRRHREQVHEELEWRRS